VVKAQRGNPAGKVVKVYNGRGDVEKRIKEGKNTLRWDKTSCQRFEANQARLKMGFLAYNLLHMIRQFYVWGEEVRRSNRLADQVFDQGGGQGFLSCQAMVCAYSLGLSPVPSLPGGAGLGFLGRPSMKNLVTKVVVCQKSGRNFRLIRNKRTF
jgi:hypothetical protein